MEMIRKIYEGIEDIKEGSREVVAVISTATPDRDNEVVSPRGMKKKNFAGNPIVMLNHDWNGLPIGKALWVRSTDDKILAKYKVSDATQTARDVFGLLQDGTLNAHSIGFLSEHSSKPTTAEMNANPELKKVKLIHRSFNLMEFSVVGIPANPEALTMAVAKGYSPDTIAFLKGKEGTETEIVEQAIQVVHKNTEKEFYDAIYEASKWLKAFDVNKAVQLAMKTVAGERK